MRAVLAAVVLVPALVMAQPVSPTTPAGRLQYAVRAGAQRTNLVWNDNSGQKGFGMLLDTEVGWRAGRWFVAGFAAYSSIDTTGREYDTVNDRITFVLTNRFEDFGVRARVYVEGAFLGLGLAYERIVETGTVTNVHPVSATMLETTISHPDHAGHGRLAELHAGYTFPNFRACGCAIQALVAVTRTSIANDNSHYLDPATASSMRVDIGVEF